MIDATSSMWILSRYLYPPSALITAMSVATCAASAQVGLAEARGRNLGYSKFSPSDKQSGRLIPSRAGMLLIYTPALLTAAAALRLLPADRRCRLLCLALFLHFFKRDVEVLFIHHYSGHIVLESAIIISLSYLMTTTCLIYTQFLTRGTLEPAVDLKYAGVVIFLSGIAGNFYHHYLLSKLRKGSDKEYRIPKGGLFGLVICPHYLFEIIGFLGISLISQTLFSMSAMLGTVFYLMGRSYATRRWYLSNFHNFPLEVKGLIPWIF